jgi:folate-binding protein YgfZ
MSYGHMTLLPDRGLVEVRGPDAAVFLQDLVTNDVESIKPGEAMFAGLLTPQGKILCDFLIHMRDPETYWLDCMRDQAEIIGKRLSMYRLRAKVEIADRSGDLAVGAAWGDKPPEGDGTFLALYADPRYAPLGKRFVMAATVSEPASLAAATGSETAYNSHRVALAVPQGGLDYAYGEAFPHEACYDELHGVDFDKGCYVGQEVVSRMHHRGTAKTRIAAIEASAPLDVGGAEIRAGEFPVGTLGSMDGTHGIAMLRLDRLEEAARHGIPLRVGDTIITARTPPWASYSVPSGKAAI